jgi:small subunit ribosomal protein S8
MSPVANMLVQIKNAQAVGKEQVLVPFSKMKFRIAQVLLENGFVKDIERKKKPIQPGTGKKIEIEFIAISLKYEEDKMPSISGFKLISKPSRHMYIATKDIKLIRSGYGIAVISTSKG